MESNYKLLIYFLLGNEYVTVQAVSEHLCISNEEAKDIINKCINDNYLTDSIKDNGVIKYYVVLDNVCQAIGGTASPRHVIARNEAAPVVHKNENSGELLAGAISLIVGVTILCLFLYACTGNNNGDSDRDYCNDNDYAYIAAKDFVKRNLKSPSTAKFSPLADVTVNKYDGCIFKFTGYVDAQNSFGAMIRETYSVKIKYNDEKDNYYLIDVKI